MRDHRCCPVSIHPPTPTLAAPPPQEMQETDPPTKQTLDANAPDQYRPWSFCDVTSCRKSGSLLRSGMEKPMELKKGATCGYRNNITSTTC